MKMVQTKSINLKKLKIHMFRAKKSSESLFVLHPFATSTSSRSSISGLSTRRLTSTLNDIIYHSFRKIKLTCPSSFRKYLREMKYFHYYKLLALTLNTLFSVFWLMILGKSGLREMIQILPR
jgi:hypothetical protein